MSPPTQTRLCILQVRVRRWPGLLSDCHQVCRVYASSAVETRAPKETWFSRVSARLLLSRVTKGNV